MRLVKSRAAQFGIDPEQVGFMGFSAGGGVTLHVAHYYSSDSRPAGHSAELHMYARGGHGFGMREQKLPADSWIERFGEWLTDWQQQRSAGDL